MDTIGSSFNTLLAVYTGNSVTSLSLVASDDQSGGNNTSKLTFAVVSGTTYQIAVDGNGGGQWEYCASPPRSPFAATTSERPLYQPHCDYRLDQYGGQPTPTPPEEAGEPSHAGNVGGKSVWWTWTAPTNGTVTVDTVGSSFDTLLAVYTGNSVAGLSVVASDDDSGGNRTSRLTFNATAGTTYQIAVDGYSGASGSVILNLKEAPPSAPVITTQPQSQTVIGGNNVTFSVATTAPLPSVMFGARMV